MYGFVEAMRVGQRMPLGARAHPGSKDCKAYAIICRRLAGDEQQVKVLHLCIQRQHFAPLNAVPC